MNDKQCGDCLHWHRIKPTGQRVPDLAAPKIGECRLEPPTLMVPLVQQSQGGTQLVGTIVAYKSLQSDFPACSHHTPRGENGVGDGVTITLAKGKE